VILAAEVRGLPRLGIGHNALRQSASSTCNLIIVALKALKKKLGPSKIK
jgi:hypothetical protein